MKIVLLISLLASFASTAGAAEDRIYRCGNEYTNTVSEAQARNCKLVSGGNVTVVQSRKPSTNRASAESQPVQRVDNGDQKAKDADSRQILESELKKAEARQAELQKEYNNGAPEKLGSEHLNNEKYLERVASLKADINRNQSDIDGIRRELSRLSPAASSSAAAK